MTTITQSEQSAPDRAIEKALLVISQKVPGAMLRFHRLSDFLEGMRSAVTTSHEAFLDKRERYFTIKGEADHWRAEQKYIKPDKPGDEKRIEKLAADVYAREQFAKEERDRAKATSEAKAKSIISHASAFGSVITYLRTVPRLVFGPAGFDSYSLKKNQTPAEAITVLADAINETRADEKSVLALSVPKGEVKDRALKEVAKLAAIGKPAFHDLLNYRRADARITKLGGGFQWASHPRIYEGRDDLHGRSLVNGAALLAFVAPDMIMAALEREIDAAIDQRGGDSITDADRLKKLESIRAKRMALELQAAQIVWNSFDAGHPLDWPKNLDARAILLIDGPDLGRV